MTLIAIVQARMTSSRLPGKVLMPLCGWPVIARVLRSVRAGCPKNTPVYVATTENRTDEPLALYAAKFATVFRGSESDVVDRFYQCALEAKARKIIRITADCVFVDPTRLRHMIGDFLEGGYDYCAIRLDPDGADIEIFTMDALSRTRDSARGDEREHVGNWMRNNLKCMPYPSQNMSDVKLSIDTLEDFHLAERLLTEVGEDKPIREYVAAARKIRQAELRAAHRAQSAPVEPPPPVELPAPICEPVRGEVPEDPTPEPIPPRKGLIERWFK